MINQKKTANAIGGKTARACESCLKKRARWFCAADDAFLCGACDSLVHSANELASRHKRVCLDTNPTAKPPPPPSWHQGFTKKARTPRNKAKAIKYSHNNYSSQMPVVPEVGNEDDHEDDGLLVEENNHESDQMVFSVPNLDDHPFENNKGVNSNSKGGFDEEEDISIADSEFNISLIGFDGDNEWDINYLPVLAEFGADVESLLEQDEEEAVVKREEERDGLVHHVCYPGLKLEQEGDIISTTTDDHSCYFDLSIDVASEMFNSDLNYSNNNDCGGNEKSLVSGAEELEYENNKKVVVSKEEEDKLNAHSMQANNKERRILLRLNYEEVSNAWASQGCSSPWITGCRPEFDLDHHGWPSYMDKFWHGDLCPTGVDRRDEEWMGVRGHVNGGDGGRSARVSRYREKRRTRLFSKKIRYEVRKLNAEKRPRLKGRFVKRTSLSPAVGL